MLTYDAKVIYQFAERLYNRANSIVATYTAIGLIAGYIAGSVLGGGSAILVGMAVIGALGYALGNERAFLLKLQAQTALCHVQIEENTRTHGRPAGYSAPLGTSGTRPAV
jgi:hypothetical protein